MRHWCCFGGAQPFAFGSLAMPDLGPRGVMTAIDLQTGTLDNIGWVGSQTGLHLTAGVECQAPLLLVFDDI